MGYASHIGRVGGLAVALGIGMAVAATPGLAYADNPDTGSADTATASKSTSTRSARKAPQSAAPAAAANNAPRAPKAAATAQVSSRGDSEVAAPARSATRPSVRTPQPAAPAAPAVAVSSPEVSVPAPAPVAAAVARSTSSPAATYHVRRPAAVVAVTKTANPLASVSGPAQWLNSILSPLFGSGPLSDQTQSPLLWAVAAFARRDFGKAFRNPTGSTTASTSLVTSPNLLVNPSAEAGDPSLSGMSAVSIPGWTLTGTPTVIKYGTPRNLWPMGLPFATPNLPAFMGFPKAGPTATSGTQFFGGGNVATATLTQTVDLSAAGAAIDGGDVTFNLSAYLGGYLIDPSSAKVKVDFLDTNRAYLGTSSIGPVGEFARLFQTGFKKRTATGALPAETRYAKVTLTLTERNPQMFGFQADYNAAFADDLSFTISESLPAPDPVVPEPVSTVGSLDHLFMVYMENKGYDDIVGSRNAPFINSLINAYGFASNYYGLTHPSLPNYYPILGGTDFGKTYNCASVCIDSPNTLMRNLDDNSKTWKSYAQGFLDGMDPLKSSGEYAVDETAFPAFSYFANNPDPNYTTDHLVPLEQMAIDLQSAATTPNFAWLAADENSNGEGPVSFPWGALKFAVSQITPGHQYNVPALDKYLSETVPTILNSAAWSSPDKSALVVTFDEDNNNTSLGFGNEGNHIVTVVIPNQAAIAAGMRGGAFTSTTHYNHYSLLRMIDDSLGLPYLTNNDKYAAPMNDFWQPVIV